MGYGHTFTWVCPCFLLTRIAYLMPRTTVGIFDFELLEEKKKNNNHSSSNLGGGIKTIIIGH